jgi:hypothetical protein
LILPILFDPSFHELLDALPAAKVQPVELVPVMGHMYSLSAFVALIDLTQNDLQKKGSPEAPCAGKGEKVYFTKINPRELK